jgi:hypothetical protein
MSWLLKTFLGLSTDANATNLNQLRTNLDLLNTHAHSGQPGDGDSLSLGAEYIQVLSLFPSGNSGWLTRTADAFLFGGYMATDDTNVGHTIDFWVNMRGGTWRLDLLHRKASNYGIATITIDGVSAGTIDFYNAVTQQEQTSSLTGITVSNLAANSHQLLRFSLSTKNASSSAYGAGLRFMALRRTGS